MVFLNNIGLILALLFREPSSSTNSTPLVESIVAVRTVLVLGNNTGQLFNKVTTVPQTQIGKGTTPVSRSDVNTETPFTNGGIEDNRVASLPFGYSSVLAKITVPTSISPTFGAGSITEVTKFIALRNSTGTEEQYMILRDIINPSEPFIAAQNINIDHEVLI